MGKTTYFLGNLSGLLGNSAGDFVFVCKVDFMVIPRQEWGKMKIP